MLALVMCAYAPDQIGAVVWEEHPTVRALIKMITSNRYRFPTVDCDENERLNMKELEQSARDKVGFIMWVLC
jgi:integrator complex subunit 1